MGLSEFIRKLWPFRKRSNNTVVLDEKMLEGMLRGIMSTRDDEIACDECFERLDRFAELVLAGEEIPEAMAVVEDHLDRCQDCREEFEALLDALRALQNGDPSASSSPQ